MNHFKRILGQLKELYLRMTGAQRLSIVLFGGTVFLMLLLFIARATGTKQEQVLFWSVEPARAAEITDKLKAMDVKYTYRNGAITLEGAADRDRVMMSLAQAGLLPEDLDFDFKKLMEKTGFTHTKDERDRNYGLALQNELAKILRGMDAIKAAKVVLSLEEENPLLVRHVKRSASVWVDVKGKRDLTKGEVEGIVNLVSSAVRGLRAEDVKITDSKGKPYKYNDQLDASDKFNLKRQMEQQYKAKIEEYLVAMVPKVVASVEVDVDLSKRRLEKKDYNGASLNKGAMAVVTQSEQEKESSKSREGSQGVTGAGTNTQAEIKEGDGGTTADMNKSRKMEKFDNSVEQEFIEFDQGSAKIKGVAVTVVDKKYNSAFRPDLPRGKDNLEFVDYDWLKKEAEAGKPSLQSIVAKVVGVEEAVVSITQQAMILEETALPPSAVLGFFKGIDYIVVAMVVLAVLAGLLALRMIKRAQPEEDILPMPEYAQEKKEELPPLEEPQHDPRVRQVEKRIKEIIDEDPSKAAGLIQSWLKE